MAFTCVSRFPYYVVNHFSILNYLVFSLVMYRRPTALQDRIRDSDDDDVHDRDYDVAALANNLSHPFKYNIYGNEDNEEVCICCPAAFWECMRTFVLLCM